MPRVLLIGAKHDQPDILQTAASLGLEIIFAQQKELFDPLVQGAYAEVALIMDYDQPAFLGVARALRADPGFDAVVSLTEMGLIPAARVSDALGLGGTTVATATLLKDKVAMRAHLDRIGLSPVRAARCTTLAELTAFARRTGFPIIVKPFDGAGSVGIVRADDEDGLRAGLERLAGLGIDVVIAEEYLDGPEFSVEGFSFAGHHVIITVTEKLVGANFLELGHVMPARIPAADWSALATMTRDFLTAVGLRDGASHTELKLTSRGPRIIEGHNRAGGDKINVLVRAAYGLDMVKMSFEWACGLIPPLARDPEPIAASAIRFFELAPGRVASVEGLDAVRAAPELLELQLRYGPGDVVEPADENFDRPGFVAVCTPSADEAERAADRLLRQVRVRTDPADACAV